MYGLDQDITVGARRRERTTLRRLAGEGRVSLRKSRQQRRTGDDKSPIAFMVVVAHPADQDGVESFPISQAHYAELLV